MTRKCYQKTRNSFCTDRGVSGHVEICQGSV